MKIFTSMKATGIILILTMLSGCGVKPRSLDGQAISDEKVEEVRKNCLWDKSIKSVKTPWSQEGMPEYRQNLVNLAQSYDCMLKNNVNQYIGFRPYELGGKVEAGRKLRSEGLTPDPEFQKIYVN
ncbi:MAG: hypothetical protein LCH61_05505 [Proteobacteria bacterium]|nr:hypothetical protein [Pseudomonadota bacterium]